MSGLTVEQRAAAVKRANDVHVFPKLVPITRMDGSVGPIEPTLTQNILLDYFDAYPWTFTDKYRQGKSSVIHISDQLRHVSYTPGAMGMIVGDKEDTYKELMRRQGIMYDGLHEALKVPLARPPSSDFIVFDKPHNGLIQGITGGGENPSIGFSPDYAIVSEYGLYENPDAFDSNFFPAINRRPNAKCRIETTPGAYNSPQHLMYKAALRGEGRFRAIFLAWWHDDTCISHDPPMPPNFRRTQEEDAYAERIAAFEAAAIAAKEPWYAYKAPCPISDEHLWFRRIALETEFHGDPRLFDAKYPPSPHEGWVVSTSPTIPAEPIAKMRVGAIKVEYDEEVFTEEPEPGCPYLLIADGTGYGKRGDPAGMILVNAWDWRVVGVWSGREDPGVFSDRILRVQKKYNADVIVETNKDGLAAALEAKNCPKLHWSNGQPGWFSSGPSKKAALVALVDALRAMDFLVPFDIILEQLATWGGKTRGEIVGKKGTHHFDLAICCLIAIYALQVYGYPRRAKPKERRPEPPKGTVYAKDYLALFEKKSKGRVLGEMS